MLMSIGGLVPLPSDALVTPVTFRVRKRKLRGILSEFDALEGGSRELSGEWVVGKKLWQRLQTEWKAAEKADTEVNNRPKSKERVVLYLHGGVFILSESVLKCC
jgi:acetyl esterase/lipase